MKKKKKKKKQKIDHTQILESLENRRLLSANLVDARLILGGPHDPDQIEIMFDKRQHDVIVQLHDDKDDGDSMSSLLSALGEDELHPPVHTESAVPEDDADTQDT
jgi:hypothetical protein